MLDLWEQPAALLCWLCPSWTHKQVVGLEGSNLGHPEVSLVFLERQTGLWAVGWMILGTKQSSLIRQVKL